MRPLKQGLAIFGRQDKKIPLQSLYRAQDRHDPAQILHSGCYHRVSVLYRSSWLPLC